MMCETVKRTRNVSFLAASLRLDGITAILKPLLAGEIYFSKLLIASNIQHKKSFLKYLDFCKNRQFITKKSGRNVNTNRGENRRIVNYSITEKGRNFLDLII